jgi:hypothetical protein
MMLHATYRPAQWLLRIWLFCLLACGILSAPIAAQDPQATYEERSFSPQKAEEKTWEAAREGLDFQEDAPPPRERQQRREMDPSVTSAWASIFKIFAILLAIGLVALILYNMLGGAELFRPRNRRIKGQLTAMDLKRIEENLQETEIDDYITQAEKNRQYDLAVRLHYLNLIKALSEQRAIRWKRDKTNGAYVHETAALPFHRQFQELTNVFEKIWYGAHPIDPAGYRQLAQQFAGLGNTIRNWNP